MAELGKAYVQIIPSADGISGKIEDVLDPESKKAGEKSGINIAGALGKALTGAIAALGVKQIISDALDAGGAIQQSFGGLDTIYGDAAAQAKVFAMQASAMGISANEYAEQAVSFGASLKQAFGGEVEPAMQAANTAIMDMTDNAAKMGTPIESIQAAYQGFAKQNYTMLDNLKLGYGGTKTEMERLLKNAQEISGVKYDISNLGDVYEAIHVIQDDLGLTGVAANEAKTTLTGSFGAMKAAAQNFLAAISTGMDISAPLSTLIETAKTYLIDNLLPMVGNIIMQIPSAAQAAFQTIGPMLGQAWQAIVTGAPGFIESGTTMIQGVIAGIVSNLPQFMAKAGELITGFVQFILQNLPSILDSGARIIMTLVTGVANNMPQILSAASTTMSNFLQMIINNLPQVLSKGVEIIGCLGMGILQAAPQLLSAAINAIGMFLQGVANNLPQILAKGGEIIGNIVSGIIRAIPKVRSAAHDIIDNIKSSFSNIDWLSIGSNIISGIARGITNGVGSIISAAKSAAQSAFKAAKDKLEIGSPSKLFARGVGKWIPAGIALGIRKNMGVLDSAMDELSANTASAYASDLTSERFMYSNTAGNVAPGGFTQVINNYSPTALNPSEIARQTRNATQQMALSLSGV